MTVRTFPFAIASSSEKVAQVAGCTHDARCRASQADR